MLKKLSIHGLRGFGKKQSIRFATPNGKEGSGLTILVGANNSGKTTILEALRSFNSNNNNPPSFSERQRNMKCENGKIHLELQMTTGDRYSIDTIESGGSRTKLKKDGVEYSEWKSALNIFVLQSRRFMDYEFDYQKMEKDEYLLRQQENTPKRSHNNDLFRVRLFKMQENKKPFDDLLKRVLGYDLEWTIDRNENSRHFLKLIVNGCTHSSEGLGDGIWSVFTICDALYDSTPGSIIAIDEPELSLHPAYQKKILQLFKEYSKDRQIIISTHSPYFVDMDSLVNGAFLHRTTKNKKGDICVFSLTKEAKQSIRGFLKNINQPHTLGTEAKEMFFLEDRIILTEGQEDVIMYSKALSAMKMQLNGTFFGWGSGGASNITKIAKILKDLGYAKVFAIFDADRSDDLNDFNNEFSKCKYKGLPIPESDVRDKPAVKKSEKKGLMTQDGEVKEEYKNIIKDIFEKINSYLKGEN